MIPEVEDVMNELDGHRVQFTVLSRWLTPEQLERPVPGSTWIVKDFISHLATIDGPVGEMFRTMHEGGDPGIRTGDGERVSHLAARTLAGRAPCPRKRHQ